MVETAGLAATRLGGWATAQPLSLGSPSPSPTSVFGSFLSHSLGPHCGPQALRCSLWREIQLWHVGSGSLTRSQTRDACTATWSLGHRTTREVPAIHLKFIYLFLATLGCYGSCSPDVTSWGDSLLWCVRARHCSGFSCCDVCGLATAAASLVMCAGSPLQRLLLLCSTVSRAPRPSVVAARGLNSRCSGALEHSLSSCGPQAWLFHSIRDLSGA